MKADAVVTIDFDRAAPGSATRVQRAGQALVANQTRPPVSRHPWTALPLDAKGSARS